jgi:hypothetical protein
VRAEVLPVRIILGETRGVGYRAHRVCVCYTRGAA